MLHLNPTHLIVKEAILNRFKSDKGESVDVRVADFDDTQYHVLVDAESKDTMTVSMSMRNCSTILSSYKSYVDEVYSGFVSEPLAGSDITLRIDLTALPASDEEKDALATKLAQIKRNVTGAPLVLMARALQKKAPMTEPFAFEFRLGEFVYYIPREDRVTVIYDVAMKDPTDFAIAKVFLQEFNEVRRLRELSSAPHPSYHPTAPQEITESALLNKTVKENHQRIGYISFGLQTRHLEDQKLDHTVNQIVQFRSYLYYHIKCSKSHMHTRMRRRVESLLQVLNRAVPDLPKDKAAKRTMTGRFFQVTAGGSAGI